MTIRMNNFLHFLHDHQNDIVGFLCGSIGGSLLLTHLNFYELFDALLFKVIVGTPTAILLGMCGVLGKDIYEKLIKKRLFKDDK